MAHFVFFYIFVLVYVFVIVVVVGVIYTGLYFQKLFVVRGECTILSCYFSAKIIDRVGHCCVHNYLYVLYVRIRFSFVGWFLFRFIFFFLHHFTSFRFHMIIGSFTLTFFCFVCPLSIHRKIFNGIFVFFSSP